MLLLSGGGDPAQVVALDRAFIQALDPRRSVLYIPLAMEGDAENGYRNCADWFASVYLPMGVARFDMLTDVDRAPPLFEYSAVFIGGGNTYALLAAVRAGGLDRALVNYLKAGGLVYGGSAGAILFGKSIESCAHADENHIGLVDRRGLDQLNGCDVWCHYTEEDDVLISAYPRALYVLYEESGLLVTEDGVEAIGRPFRRHFPG